MQVAAPRIMVAGTSSGSGKTTITCGLLRALARRELPLQACKSGPDYIDPLFHSRVLGIPSQNLDLFLAGPTLVRTLLAEGAHGGQLTVIEGAMGYYDGIAQSHEASSYELARVTRTPVVLVVDGRGRALSMAAEVLGFLRLRTPSQISGVIVNRVSPGYYPAAKALVEAETGMPVLGYLPQLDEAHLASRHLGLVAASEVADLTQRVDAVADVLERTVDLDALVALAQGAPKLEVEPRELPAPRTDAPLIAVADDLAFSFCYHETLELFERLGARVARFSPLDDEELPAGSCGLYLGGGYPELHAARLSENRALRTRIRTAVEAGMPTIAECGGFMYLQEMLEDADGKAWPMVGALPGRCTRGERLTRFGYVTLTAGCDSLLARAGEQLRAHEFHYWDSDHAGDAFHAQKPQSTRGWDCCVSTGTLYAGYPHLYLCGSPAAAKRFVDACAAFAARNGGAAR